MKDMYLWWLLVGGSYFLGSFSTAHLVGWMVGHDPSREGSKNPGATNVFRIAGYGPAAIVLLGDILKGTIPALIAFFLTDRYIALAAGAAAVVGHIFPIFMKFKGGKGVATYGGMLIALNPFVGLICIGIWAFTLVTTKLSSIASLLTVFLSVLGVALRDREIWETATLAGLALFIASRHYQNIKRLIKGEENSLEAQQKKSEAEAKNKDTKGTDEDKNKI